MGIHKKAVASRKFITPDFRMEMVVVRTKQMERSSLTSVPHPSECLAQLPLGVLRSEQMGGQAKGYRMGGKQSSPRAKVTWVFSLCMDQQDHRSLLNICSSAGEGQLRGSRAFPCQEQCAEGQEVAPCLVLLQASLVYLVREGQLCFVKHTALSFLQ